MSEHLFTSESVSEGHPDKIADQISDSILDAILEQDPKARVACETLVNTGMVILAGEITTSAWVDMNEVVRNRIKEIGYNHSDMGFDYESCAILTSKHIIKNNLFKIKNPKKLFLLCALYEQVILFTEFRNILINKHPGNNLIFKFFGFHLV